MATRRWTGQKQDVRRAERRDLLIDAATHLYGSVGYRNASVRSICREASLTERYFYESFANSEDLLLAAFHRIVLRLRNRVAEQDIPGAIADERMRCLLHAFFSALSDNPVAARVFTVEIVGVSAAVDHAVEASMIEMSALVLKIYDPGGRGPLSVDPLLRRGLSGGILHIAVAWATQGYQPGADQIVETALPLCRLAIPRRPASSEEME